MDGVHAVLIDVHRRPLAFSFADGTATELQIVQPSLPAPSAVSYRVGEPAAAGGRLLAICAGRSGSDSRCRPSRSR